MSRIQQRNAVIKLRSTLGLFELVPMLGKVTKPKVKLDDGSEYEGQWNNNGKKDGFGV